MKKRLTKKLTLFFNKYYPFYSTKISNKKHTVVIGIGGNIGNTVERFRKLFIYLKRKNNFDLIQTSPILKNPPFGYIEQNDFYNAIIVIKTNLNPFQTLKQLLRIEKKFKRKRKFKDSPRTLDLDIIFFDKINVFKKDLIIPHKEFYKRESVMIPLSYLMR